MSKLKKYSVVGEYGIQEGDHIQRDMRAKSAANASYNFISYVRKNFPHLVDRMSVRIEEI